MRRLLLALGIVGLIVLVVVLVTDPLSFLNPVPRDPEGQDDEADLDPGRAGDAIAAATGQISGTVRRRRIPVAASLALLTLGEEETLLTSAVGRGAPLRTVRVGNTGSFLIDRLPPGRYRLRATTSDGRTGSAVVRLRHPGERVQAFIEIPVGPHVLRGRAVYADGRPFLGLVSAEEQISRGRLMRVPGVATSPEGVFEIKGLEPGIVRISCLIPDEYRLVGPWIRIPHDAEFLLVVDREASVLAGRVIDEADGTPIPDARVRVTGDTTTHRFCVVMATTDAAGRFSVGVLPIRRTIQVEAKGYSAVKRDVPDDAEELTIGLGRTARISGRVLIASGQRPRPGVTVYCEPLNNWSDGEWKAVSGPDGRFTLDDVPTGPVTVFARGNGWVSPDLGRRSYLREIRPGVAESLTLSVIPAVRVKGRVVDEAGAGLAGVLVRVDSDSGFGPVLPEPLGTVTAADGTFAFDSLVPGMAYVVQARPWGHYALASRTIVGDSGETVAVTFEVATEEQSARWLEIRVIDHESGELVHGATVTAAFQSGRTGKNGVARLGPFGPRTVTVRVTHPDYVRSDYRPVLEPDAGLIEMTYPLQRGLAVAGRAFLPDGRPLESGTVRVSAAVAESGAPGDAARGQVTAGGEFHVGGLLAGSYRVKIHGAGHGGRGYTAEVVTEAGVTDLSLTTRPFVPPHPHKTLVFRVEGPDGEPVPFGTVEVRFTGVKETWSNDFAVEDGQASFDFWGLDGTVTVVAHGARTLSGRRLPLGSARVGPVPLEEGELTIRLSAEREISGVVRDERGRPVAGARLAARPAFAEELELEEEHAVAWSNDRGAFRLGGLGDGEHQITVNPPAGFLLAPPILARAGTKGLSVAVTTGVIARIRVVGPDGAPLVGAAVHVHDPDYEDERTFEGYGRRDGVVVLEGLEPDRPYRMVVTPPVDGRPLMSVTQEGFRPADVEIMLPEGRMVGGVVVFPDGSRAPGVFVFAHSEGGRDERGGTAFDGSFRFGPFPPGPVRLTTRFAGQDSEPVVVAAGREDLKLTCPAGVRLSVRILDWSESYGPVRARLSTRTGTRWAVVSKDGTVAFTDLPDGDLHALWVGPVGEGLYILMKELAASEVTVEARLLRGGQVSGQLVLPAGAKDAGVRVSGGGASLTGLVDDQGRFRVTGVPEGSCVVTAWATIDRRRIEGSVWARTGDSVTLELGTE